MDGHDLDRLGAGLDVGLGVELGEARGERAEVFELARGLEPLELVEEDLGVLEVGAVLDAGRAAEREPDAFDTVARRRDPLVPPRAAQDDVPGGYEPLLGDAERLSVVELIEEQVLLGLPLVPMHETAAECGAVRAAPGGAADEPAAVEETQRPFANLRELLEKGKS